MKRLLLDQGIPRSTARILNTAGWDAVHVSDIGMSQARDRAILEFAGRDKRICITLDADFHAILAVTSALGPSVIRIRREGLRGDELAVLLTEIWPRIEVQTEQGAMISITKHDIRVRRLPILQDAEGN